MAVEDDIQKCRLTLVARDCKHVLGRIKLGVLVFFSFSFLRRDRDYFLLHQPQNLPSLWCFLRVYRLTASSDTKTASVQEAYIDREGERAGCWQELAFYEKR